MLGSAPGPQTCGQMAARQRDGFRGDKKGRDKAILIEKGKVAQAAGRIGKGHLRGIKTKKPRDPVRDHHPQDGVSVGVCHLGQRCGTKTHIGGIGGMDFQERFGALLRQAGRQTSACHCVPLIADCDSSSGSSCEF